MDISMAQILGSVAATVIILGLYMISVKKELSNS